MSFLYSRSTSNQIDGRMEYIFQDGDAIQPVSFLMSYVFQPLQQWFQEQQPVFLWLFQTSCKFCFSVLRTTKNGGANLLQTFDANVKNWVLFTDLVHQWS